VGTSGWQLAERVAGEAGIRILEPDALEGAGSVSRLIMETWGAQDLPRELLRAFIHAGVLLYGAEAPGGEMAGFVFGFAGFAEGLHVHSHMLAVLPPWRSRGVGLALKLAQRAGALDLGIEDVRWTFDPLIARNARFNLTRLGCVATAFHRAFYGDMQDKLNRGDRSDRFEVRWHLRSERVERMLAGEAEEPPAGEFVLEAVGDPDAPRPKETGTAPEPGARVAVPRDYFGLRQRDPSLGREWRNRTAEAFEVCFAQGLVPTWCTNEPAYVFEPREDGR
jgi:predicted GNAT superfamily acetyltransferase